MRRPRLIHGPHGRHQRLAENLPAEHPLPADLRAEAPEKVDLERFQIEQTHKLVEGTLSFVPIAKHVA